MTKRPELINSVLTGAVLLFFSLAGISVAGSKSLVCVDWLADNLDRRDLVILDVSEFTNYERGHIPGAVKAFGPWQTMNDDFLGFMVPSPDKLVKMLREYGINNHSFVVVYDEGTTARETSKSARALWTLHSLGHDESALLNGGFSAWEREGRQVSRKPVTAETGNFGGNLAPGKVANLSGVKKKLGDEQVVFLDCRSTPEHFGQEKKSYIDRYGHLPGSRLWPAGYMTTAGPDNSPSLFREVGVLKKMAAGVGIPEDKSVEIVTYSNRGLTAALGYFVLHDLLDYQNVRIFDGSILEAAGDKDIPMTKLKWGYKNF